MASNRLPVAELRALLTAVSEHGSQHLLEVEADLKQTTFLLSGAIEKLSSSFMAIHEAIISQQQKVDELLNVAGVPRAARRSVDESREKIGIEVNAAITGLQFQDMTSQLIARVLKRVEGLRDSLAGLAIHGVEMDAEREHEEIVKLLEEMSVHLTTRNDALKGGILKSVAQQNMNSGEVELF